MPIVTIVISQKISKEVGFKHYSCRRKVECVCVCVKEIEKVSFH
jgi:hypothetical protein